ncbi:uncharacterized protein LOC127857893 [Dreissena polymorpha]|uniref:Uncharacterized protein n=1 Tax=Dreissena polymorpha TaxID=45954 RepID=A0A9D3YYN3_DREPO|nr:uncharacterized protein LOC127857893 [Dreissena polymorpha]KAH3707425.1 hypothetical protein DPMN_066831 [Dreissena polymorpha]
MDHRLLMLLLSLCLLPTVVVGLQCPSCTYAAIPTNIKSYIRTVNESILSLFQDEPCSHPINGPTTGINEVACAPPEGKIARCSFHNGSIEVEAFSGKIEPLQIYHRGCYYSLTADVPSDGCHNRSEVNEDKSILQQIIPRDLNAVHVVYFKGEICLCSDTYCQTSGPTTDQTTCQTTGLISGSSSVFGSASFVLSVISVLFM